MMVTESFLLPRDSETGVSSDQIRWEGQRAFDGVRFRELRAVGEEVGGDRLPVLALG